MEELELVEEYLYDSTDSSDEDLLNVGNMKTRNENYLEQTVPSYTDEEFFENFRVSRNVANQLFEMYRDSAYYNDHIGQFGNISPYYQVIIFLWYIGHQSAGFVDVSDRFNISISSLEKIIRKLAVFISNMSNTVITWPTNEEKVQIEADFRENGFPNIIGAIDGCHVRIDKPEIDSDSYINRKGFYSVQMQVVCDSRRKIRDVFVGYPGSVHDSRVFRNSSLFRTLPEKCGRFFLLADSGYPLQNNLLTPFKDRGHLTRRQLNYNLLLARNRYKIEHCFGLVKQKFRQLYHIKLRKMEYIIHLIRAACVLHNIALDDDVQILEVNLNINLDNLQQMENEDEGGEENQAAQVIRNNIVNALPMR